MSSSQSINLFVGVILGYISPKAFPKECCYCGAYQWSNFSPTISAEEVFHLLVNLKQAIVFVSGRLSPHNFEMFSISPLQACAFRCWFSNNSVQFFFARMLSKLICGRSWHFLLHSVIPMIYLLLFLSEALWRCSFRSPSRFVRIVLFSCLSI